MYNIKLRFSELIIKSDVEKQMIEYGCRPRFMTLDILKLGIFFIFLRFILCLRISSQIFFKKTIGLVLIYHILNKF